MTRTPRTLFVVRVAGLTPVVALSWAEVESVARIPLAAGKAVNVEARAVSEAIMLENVTALVSECERRRKR